MKPAVIHENVIMIPIDRIDVLNPRSRNKKQHLEIVKPSCLKILRIV